MIGEIREIVRRYRTTLVWFLDSNIGVDKEWLKELMGRYRTEIGLPFYCKVRPDSVSDKVPYYVTQMVSRNYLPLCVQTEATSPGNALDASATLSEDRKTLTLQVVNTGKVALPTRLELAGFVPHKPTAHATVLTGGWEDTNTPEQPGRVKPDETDWRHDFKDGIVTRTFPPYSFTVMQFK